MRIEEEIINEFKKVVIQMAGYKENPDTTPEKEAYVEGVLDSFSLVDRIIDNYEMNTKDGNTEITIGWLGLAQKLSFETVDEAVEVLADDYSDNMTAISIPTLPVSVLFEIEISKSKGLPIWEFFDKAKESKDEMWAQWALDNSSTVASAWVASRYNLQ